MSVKKANGIFAYFSRVIMSKQGMYTLAMIWITDKSLTL